MVVCHADVPGRVPPVGGLVMILPPPCVRSTLGSVPPEEAAPFYAHLHGICRRRLRR